MSTGAKAPTPPPKSSVRPTPPTAPPDPGGIPTPPPGPSNRKPADPIGTPEDLARGVTMRCHRGHTSPAGLWNCPVCTDPTLDAIRRLDEAGVIERWVKALREDFSFTAPDALDEKLRTRLAAFLEEVRPPLPEGEKK